MSSIQEKIGVATKWSSITEIASRLVAPFTNAVLARLLAPEIFGVVATLTLVVSFAEIFTDAGFQKYLVQHEFVDDEDLNIGTNVAFWTNFSFSLVMWGLITIFVKPIAALVGATGYESAIVVISLEIPILAFSSIQMARYRRSFDFKSLFYSRIATSLVPVVVTIPVAFIFNSHWALVIGTLAKDILNAIILTVKSQWKPRFRYSLKKLKEMAAFSIWTVCENVFIWLTVNIDIFIIGAVLSSYYLGLYKTTIATASAYMNIITAATTPVLFSALSRCQNDHKEFKKVFFQFQRTVAILVFPIGIGAFVYRDFLTSILLGSQWAETADFLGMWFLTSSFTIVYSNYCSEAFRGVGKPTLSILTQICSLLLLIPLVLYGVGQSYQCLTILRSLVRMDFIVGLLILQKAIKIPVRAVLKNTLPAVICAVGMGIFGAIIRGMSSGIVWEIVSIFCCMIVYFALMLLVPGGKKQLAEFPMTKIVYDYIRTRFINRLKIKNKG